MACRGHQTVCLLAVCLACGDVCMIATFTGNCAARRHLVAEQAVVLPPVRRPPLAAAQHPADHSSEPHIATLAGSQRQHPTSVLHGPIHICSHASSTDES